LFRQVDFKRDTICVAGRFYNLRNITALVEEVGKVHILAINTTMLGGLSFIEHGLPNLRFLLKWVRAKFLSLKTFRVFCQEGINVDRVRTALVEDFSKEIFSTESWGKRVPEVEVIRASEWRKLGEV
jgi:hypothetical protein